MDQESREMWSELKMYEYSSYKLDSRCCRQVKLGTLSVDPKDDPVLLHTAYKLQIKYCPECGKELS